MATGVEPDRPAPGSHARDVPSGRLEESAATLYEAATAARDAADDDAGALAGFYRAVIDATLLLPVPPGGEDETRGALQRAVDDQDEVEVPVMAARAADGSTVNVVFGSHAALAAWSPLGTASLALPARVVLANLVAAGLPAILDPAGPIPYRFEPDELADLHAGRLPGTHQALDAPRGGASVRVRLPGPEAEAIERSLAGEVSSWPGVREAYLFETDGPRGRQLVLGLVGGGGALPPAPGAVEVAWLAEPLLAAVRGMVRPLWQSDR